MWMLLLLGGISASLSAQSTDPDELKAQLENATNTQERYAIGYQLATVLTDKRQTEAPKYAEDTYSEAKRLGKRQLMADAAYLTARAYESTRRYGKAEYWWKVTTQDAMAADNGDLLLRAVEKRSKIATRERNYAAAVRIYEEALDYFTRDGNDIGNLRAKVEAESSRLEAARQQLERQRTALTDELEILREEQEILEEENDQLLAAQEKKSEELQQREADLERIREAKAEVDQKVAATQREVKTLSRDALEAKVILEEREKELQQVELLQKESDLRAMQAEMASERSNTLRNYAIGAGALLLLLSALLYSRFVTKKRDAKALRQINGELDEAREQSDKLLLNILPSGIAEELKATGTAKTRKFDDVTILFSDFVNFTRISELLDPEDLVAELDFCFQAFDRILDDYEDLEKIKTIGDAYMVASDLDTRKSIPTNLVRAALRMQAFLTERQKERTAQSLPYFEARIGLHTGTVVAGVVGSKKFAYDVWGDTVNTASRVENQCAPGKVNVSETTYRLIKYQFDCEYRGKVQAKNKGFLDMYYVNSEL